MKYEQKRPPENFKVDMQDEIDDIPDYVTSKGDTAVKVTYTVLTVLMKILFAVSIIGISVFTAFEIIDVAKDIFALHDENDKVTINIPQDSGMFEIGQILEDSGVVVSKYAFQAYHRFLCDSIALNYGSFELTTNMSYLNVVRSLAAYTKTDQEVTIMFREGSSIMDIALQLEENNVCTKEAFIEALQNIEFENMLVNEIDYNDMVFYELEGYLFPDTYNFYINDNPTSVINKMVKNFDARVSTDILEQIEESGYTLNEVITVASIVQKEAGNYAEMRNVAAVYLNRLNSADFPRLQADPTIHYANAINEELETSDQSQLDAYNTYVCLSLPAGPICNPGLDAIKAVLDPTKSEYYYFCTDSITSEFYYATTYEEHIVNVEKAGI